MDNLVETISYNELPVAINDSKAIFESFSGEKQKYEIIELNKMFRKLFESCNINFLIGAGYSYERLKTLGNLEKLIEENSIINEENANKKKAIEALILYDFFRNSIYPHKADLQACNSFENSNRFVLELAKMLSNRNDKNLLSRANIFTSNYDMFFELSLETSGIYYNDGFSGLLAPYFSTQNYNKIVKQIVQNTERESQIPTVNVYKIHGSLSWNKQNDEILYRTHPSSFLEDIEVGSSIFDNDCFYYDRSKPEQLHVDGSIIEINNNVDCFEEEILTKVEGVLEKYKQLHIINPTKKKFEETLLSNVYYDLLRMYSNELEKNNSILIVFGFSFRDEHIYSITKRALSNPSMIIYIFIFDISEVEHFKGLFKNHNNVFYIYYENKKIDLHEFSSMVFGGQTNE